MSERDVTHVSEEQNDGVSGVCPECGRGSIIAVVDSAGGVRVKHGSAVRVCIEDAEFGPTYYFHPASQ